MKKEKWTIILIEAVQDKTNVDVSSLEYKNLIRTVCAFFYL